VLLMPQKAPHTVHILEGKATLYQRPTTPQWFVRYKVGGKWLRSTTKQNTLEAAKQAAVDIVTNAWFREKNDLPIVNKRFKHVANLAIKRMEDLLANGQGKVTYKHYIQAINKYLIKFLGNHNIDKIDYALLTKFSIWREQQMRTTPSQSAINTHNSALNRVFDEALLRGFITKSQVPYLENKGVTSERRDDFTVEEYKQLYQYMRKWVKAAREGREKAIRNLLRDYVLILANTGIRAGTEAMNLKWQHITIVKQDGQEYLTLNVKGKTKKMRAIQVPHRVAIYLQRIQMRDDEINGMSFYELIDAGVDKYVFRIDDKDMTSNFGKIFKRLLEAAGLLVDRRSGKDRTLYCLRHYYATLRITIGQISTKQLAEYMGTSEGMIEKHYGHLDLQRIANKFVGAGTLGTTLKVKSKL
jgi:integrase